MTSAFVIQVQPQLQPDPNDEMAALLRVLISKIDNTTFGNNVPTVPQWSGPAQTIVQVQAILYASLATSLFSSFLAMLGKQWLNRYASIDMRGSAIERSQNRQRKLDGIITWYFDHVMESLPLMLQFALLLLGCALSLYLWNINTIVMSVVLGITSFGIVLYIFIIIAGATFAGCPYQTPGALILRYILLHIHHNLPLVLSALHSVSSSAIRGSTCIAVFIAWQDDLTGPEYSIGEITFSLVLTLLLPIWLAYDIYILMQVMVRTSYAHACRIYGWFCKKHESNPQVAMLDLQTAVLDLECITWVLQTSLDKAIHLLTLKSLMAVTTLANSNPTLVSACFSILVSCVTVVGGDVVVTKGSEELVVVSALCCLRTLSHLTTIDPESSVLRDVRWQYTKTFSVKTDFKDFPSYHYFSIIHHIFYPPRRLAQWQTLEWDGYNISSNVNVFLVQLAKSEYQRRRCQKVPRWILRFALHCLSQHPLPPTSVVTDCLLIIATDLGCVIPSAITVDKRYVYNHWVFVYHSDQRTVSNCTRFLT